MKRFLFFCSLFIFTGAAFAQISSSIYFLDRFNTYKNGSDGSPIWNPVKGSWQMVGNAYIQRAPDYDCASLYDVFLNESFEIEVSFKHLSGDVGAGLLFSSYQRTNTSYAQMVRFDGQSVFLLGYYSGGEFTTQWAALDLEAAENSWGIAVPPFVKSELLYALQYTQGDDGGFGYDTPNYWENITKTAAAIGSYAFIGATVDTPAVASAMNFLDGQWSLTGVDYYGWDQPFSGNTYAMYGVAKGMRIINHREGQQYIGTHDWYAEYVSHFLDDPTWKQNPNGSFPRSSNYPCALMGDPLNTSLAVLVLIRGVVVAPPVAIIEKIGAVPPNTPFQVDGSHSYHQDPTKSIVEWKWDFNAANGIDWDHPDAFGQRPTNPGYADTGTYYITLRVKDNSDPPLYSTVTDTVRVRASHLPPVAVPIPHDRGTVYAARVGEAIFLDGRESNVQNQPNDSIVGYSWDLDGNGIFGDATTDTLTVHYNEEYQGQVGLRVYDSYGDSNTSSTYIEIVASRKNLFVKSLNACVDSLFPHGMVNIKAIVKNDDESNTNVNHVLVRFFDNNPLTTGSQIGEDYYVDLAIGEEDTIKTSIQLPDYAVTGGRKIFVYLDPTNQVAEWNKLDNLLGTRVDLSIPEFTVSPDTLYLGDTLHVHAIFRSNEGATISLKHILVRLFNDASLSADYTLGCDHYVDLPVGASDTLNYSFALPTNQRGGTWHLYEFVDADNQVAETNEENNVATRTITVLEHPGHLVLDKQCLNFATVDPNDNKTLIVGLSNDGSGIVSIDSIRATDTSFTYYLPNFTIESGNSTKLAVMFNPKFAGMFSGMLNLYTNAGTVSLQLLGQGTLPSDGNYKQTFQGLASVNHDIAPEGSVVGVFRTNGMMVTSTTVTGVDDIYNYELTVQTGQARLAAGDTLLFKVWVDDCTWKNDTYCEPFIQYSPLPEGDTTYTNYDIHAGDPVALSIPVGPRFNPVSWNVIPESTSTAAVFGALMNTQKVQIVLGYNNNDTVPKFDYYIPEVGQYNTLQATNFKNGYLVKLKPDVQPDSLQVHGTPVCPTTPIPLKSDVNFVSYFPQVPESTAVALHSLSEDNLSVALEFSNTGTSGLFNYYPGGGFNVMRPGKGYVVDVVNPDVLIYPIGRVPDLAKPARTAMKHPSGKTDVTIPNIPIVEFAYGTHVSIYNHLIPAGTPIRAVDSDGNICGFAQFSADGVYVLPIRADNPATPQDEGATIGEMVKIIIGENELVSLRVQWTDFADVHKLDGNLTVTGVSDQIGVPVTYALSQNYPNPFNPTTTIRFQLPAESHVKLTIYSLLGQEITTLVNGDLSAGFKSYQFDASDIPNGVYYYRIEATSTSNANKSFVDVKKMILLK